MLCLLPFGCTTFVCLPKIRHGEGGDVYVNVSRFGVSQGKKLCVWACFVSSGLGVSISVRVYACGCVGSLCVCVWGEGR